MWCGIRFKQLWMKNLNCSSILFVAVGWMIDTCTHRCGCMIVIYWRYWIVNDRAKWNRPRSVFINCFHSLLFVWHRPKIVHAKWLSSSKHKIDWLILSHDSTRMRLSTRRVRINVFTLNWLLAVKTDLWRKQWLLNVSFYSTLIGIAR